MTSPRAWRVINGKIVWPGGHKPTAAERRTAAASRRRADVNTSSKTTKHKKPNQPKMTAGKGYVRGTMAAPKKVAPKVVAARKFTGNPSVAKPNSTTAAGQSRSKTGGGASSVTGRRPAKSGAFVGPKRKVAAKNLTTKQGAAQRKKAMAAATKRGKPGRARSTKESAGRKAIGSKGKGIRAFFKRNARRNKAKGPRKDVGARR